MWMIGTKCTILEGTLLWCGGKLKELPWLIQAQRTHTPPNQYSQQSQILEIGWDSTHKDEHLFNVFVIAMLHEGNNYTTCKLKQRGVNIKLIIFPLGVMIFILWVILQCI